MVFNAFVLPGVEYTTESFNTPNRPEVKLRICAENGSGAGAFCDSLREPFGSKVVIINGKARKALADVCEEWQKDPDSEAFKDAFERLHEYLPSMR